MNNLLSSLIRLKRDSWESNPTLHYHATPCIVERHGLLAMRFVRFLQKCLSSDTYAVRFIANYGVYVGRMFSSIGRNAFFCCSSYRF